MFKRANAVRSGFFGSIVVVALLLLLAALHGDFYPAVKLAYMRQVQRSCPKSVEQMDGAGKVVLVTGAAGFIGSHVAAYCAEMLRMHVVAVDDLSGGFMSNVPVHRNLLFIRGDVKNATFLSALFAKYEFEYVYHLAAYAAEGLSHFIRSYNYRNNLVGSVELLNAAVKSHVDCFVFTSSIAVYGAGQTPMLETMTPEPEDPYGISKYAVELDLKAAKHMWDMDYVIFRPHNVYGPHQNLFDRYRNVIGIFMNQILSGKPLTIFGDGEQTRAFSYIDDVAPYIARGPLVKAARNHVFNVGADQPYTLNTLAEEVSDAMGVKTNVVHFDPRKEVEHAESDHFKVRCFFNPHAKPVDLTTGLARMVKWVKQQGRHFAPIEFKSVEVMKAMPSSWVTSEMVEDEIIVHTGPDKSDLTDVRLQPATDQTDQQLTITFTTREPRIFYFGVTHETTHERAVKADETWCRRVMPNGFPWYSTAPDARLKNLTIYVPPEGSSYDDLYYRMLGIWKHVLTTYPGYDWYVRSWDDNYVIHERMVEIASKYEPNKLLEIGDVHPHQGVFIDGGATSLLSSSAAKKLLMNFNKCPEKTIVQEDVSLSTCHRDLGVVFVDELGFNSYAPRPACSRQGNGPLDISQDDLACRRIVVGDKEKSVPVTFHYVSEEGMKWIDQALYETPCNIFRK